MFRRFIPHPLLLCGALLYSLLGLYILGIIDPWQENLTGLGHLYGRYDLLYLAAVMNCTLIAASTWLLWTPSRPLKERLVMVFCMVLCLLSAWIPYSPTGSFFNDLHVWLGVGGYLLYFALWIRPVLLYGLHPDFCESMVVVSYAIGLVFFSFQQEVNGWSELLSMNVMIWSFIWKLETEKGKSSKSPTNSNP